MFGGVARVECSEVVMLQFGNIRGDVGRADAFEKFVEKMREDIKPTVSITL